MGEHLTAYYILVCPLYVNSQPYGVSEIYWI